MTGNGSRRPNICFILTDQERHRGWLPDDVDLPARRRLLERGQEFDRHYTHTSPCLPSRATLVTGQYMPAHGIKENTRGPANGWLNTGVETLGKMLRRDGYYTGYKGKWHLSMGPYADMESYGFGDWEGNDQAFWGQAGSGVEFDEPIAASAAQWIHNRADDRQPWFLMVGLVNPRDIMWFPIDQPWYHEANPEHYGGCATAIPPWAGVARMLCLRSHSTTPSASVSCPPTSTTTCTPSPMSTAVSCTRCRATTVISTALTSAAGYANSTTT